MVRFDDTLAAFSKSDKLIALVLFHSYSGDYYFKPGILNSLFDNIVHQWFELEINTYLAQQAVITLNAKFFGVFLEVPSRFIDGLIYMSSAVD